MTEELDQINHGGFDPTEMTEYREAGTLFVLFRSFRERSEKGWEK